MNYARSLVIGIDVTRRKKVLTMRTHKYFLFLFPAFLAAIPLMNQAKEQSAITSMLSHISAPKGEAHRFFVQHAQKYPSIAKKHSDSKINRETAFCILLPSGICLFT